MRLHCLAGAVAGVIDLGARRALPAQDFQMRDVPALPPLAGGALAPHTILFTDHRNDELVDPATGLIHFADWEHARPQQKRLLSLFPSYEEPTGSHRPRRQAAQAATARLCGGGPLCDGETRRHPSIFRA